MELMKKLEALRAQKAESISAMEVLATMDAMNEEQVKQFDSHKAEIAKVNADIERIEALVIEKNRAEAEAKNTAKMPHATPTISEPARPRRHSGTLKNFKGPDAADRAYRFGMWVMAARGSTSKRVLDYCATNGLQVDYQAADPHSGGNNIYGGYLVPLELDSEIIDLKNEYGVFRKYAKLVSMGSDTKDRIRKTGRVTASFAGEGSAGTHSKGTWDRVSLVAKKLMVLTTMTSELNEDSIISLADELAGDIAYAYSLKEDQCGFIGDGTSTYGGIVGVTSKLTTLNGVDNGGGVVLAAGNTYDEVTLANLRDTVARLPKYAERGSAWFCSKTVAHSVIYRLLDAAGGNTAQMLSAGGGGSCMGFPVVETEVLPSAAANSQIAILFGNLALAADYGERRGSMIDFTSQGTIDGISMFETDQIGVRGTERFDINVHDLGTATVAGPVVGLITAAS